MRVYDTDLNRHAHYAMRFVYTEGTHANITPKATRATKCSEASQYTGLVGNLQVQYMGHYLGLTLLASSYVCHASKYFRLVHA